MKSISNGFWCGYFDDFQIPVFFSALYSWILNLFRSRGQGSPNSHDTFGTWITDPLLVGSAPSGWPSASSCSLGRAPWTVWNYKFNYKYSILYFSGNCSFSSDIIHFFLFIFKPGVNHLEGSLAMSVTPYNWQSHLYMTHYGKTETLSSLRKYCES